MLFKSKAGLTQMWSQACRYVRLALPICKLHLSFIKVRTKGNNYADIKD